jgi:transmembrane sensor
MQYNKKNIDSDILKRFIYGNCSTEEAIIVKQWFTNPDMEQELSDEALLFWNEITLDADTKGYSGEHILDHIHHNIKIEEAVFLNKPDPKRKFINYLNRIAAILFIPLFIAFLIMYSHENTHNETISFAEIHSPFGTRTNFYLPDGSTGWLNGGSSLKFPTHFNGKSRDVKLVGEAYFNVTSNHKKPFFVSTRNVEIKVFGTSFNVMAYADEQITEVTLERGKVEVFKKANNAIESIGILKPDESCTYDYVSDSSNILSINSSEKLSWIDGKLVFKYEPFEVVVRKMNRLYNVNIVIKDELLKSYIYYGTFKDEKLEEVLKLLQYTAPIRYKDLKRERNLDGSFEKRKIEIYYKKTSNPIINLKQ